MRSSRTLALFVAAAFAVGACQSGRDAGQRARPVSAARYRQTGAI